MKKNRLNVLIFCFLVGSLSAASIFSGTAETGAVKPPQGQALLLPATNIGVRLTAPLSSLHLKEEVKISDMTLPSYPASLLNAGIIGECDVLFELKENGSVTNIRAGRYSNVEFSDAALAAVMKWKIKPLDRYSGGESIFVTATFVFSIYNE